MNAAASMNERAIRQGIVDGLRAAHVPGARDAALMQAFKQLVEQPLGLLA